VAAATADARSDWGLGVYYRGALDVAALGIPGAVHPPAACIMNGGAWLSLGGHMVDVLLCDMDVVELWREGAIAGALERR
jgi:hypothetical protein